MIFNIKEGIISKTFDCMIVLSILHDCIKYTVWLY